MEKFYQLYEFRGEYMDDFVPINNKLFRTKEDALKSSIIYKDSQVIPLRLGDYLLGVYELPSKEELKDIKDFVWFSDSRYKHKVIELETV